MSEEPVMNVNWVRADQLTANGWNPNYVLDAELRLIETSILRNGWTQAIIIRPGGEIVDGFHRWRLAQDSKLLMAKYGGFVPCVTLEVTDAEAMMMTVRVNRAKGKHAALRMSSLVRQLLEKGLEREEIARGIGATLGEIDTLAHEDVFAMKGTADYRYSRSWRPTCRLETGKVNS